MGISRYSEIKIKNIVSKIRNTLCSFKRNPHNAKITPIHSLTFVEDDTIFWMTAMSLVLLLVALLICPGESGLGKVIISLFHTYQEFECLSALLQVFHLTEDYDKAIIPYQTKPYALNVTAEIYLRSFILR